MFLMVKQVNKNGNKKRPYFLNISDLVVKRNLSENGLGR